jgi:hypothetical protein
MPSKTSFTYDHPKLGPVQHVVTRELTRTMLSNGISITFEDDKERLLTIVTNGPYVLRTETTREDVVVTPYREDDIPTIEV